jgi:hypothetical protein
MIHLTNSAVMPAGNFGTYRYSPATLADLSDTLAGKRGPWLSAIGYPQNVEFLV